MEQAIRSITEQVKNAVEEVCHESGIQENAVFVLGCSSSEIRGQRIGKGGSIDIGKAVIAGALEAVTAHGAWLAVQCCEHLNRALVIERECAKQFGYEEVTVRPVWNAGGSAAAAAMELFKDPVVVLEIKADAGMDIGCTMIGMHLKRVAVPVRLVNNKVGEAVVNGAKTRPMLIGGERAQYK